MGDQHDFISQFHNLNGDLIGERKRSLFKLISNPSLFQNEQQQNEALENLEPKTYQEALFYVDTLIYFKRTEKLFEILKGGNQLFATKILKQPWFFDLAFKNIEVNKLVNEYVPFFSYVVRQKLVKRLSRCWNEREVDYLFDALNEKYGLSAAVPILPKCTVFKIKSVLKDNDIKLAPNQVIELINKNEDILKFYLTQFKTITGSVYSEQKVVRHIGLKYPKLLLELVKDKILHAHSVGRRTTKNIMKMFRDDISGNYELYLQFLNKPVVVRKLGTEFITFFKQIFPQTFLELSNFCIKNEFIKYYPKSRRWQLFYETCNEYFVNKSEEDILVVLSPDITNFNPPQEILHKWAAIKYEKCETDYEDYLKYYPASKAIEIVMEKINIISDANRRSCLLRLLIEMCARNKDGTSLEIILKHVCTRYKKEIQCATDLLSAIRNTYKLKNLNETHWKYIHDLLTALEINKDYQWYWHADQLGIHYLKFLVENGIDDEEAYIRYFKVLYEEDYFFTLLNLKNADVGREIYIRFCKILSNMAEKPRDVTIHNFICLLVTFNIEYVGLCINLNEYPIIVSKVVSVFNKDKFERSELQLIQKVIIYNDFFPQYAFSISNSTLLNIFTLGIQQQGAVWDFNDVFNKIVNKKNRTVLGNDLLHLYLDSLYKEYPDTTLTDWLLKNEPRRLIPYYDIILEHDFDEDDGTFLDNKFVKQYSHLGFDKRMKEYYMKLLDETNKDDTNVINKCIARSYSILTPEEIIKIVEDKFLPKNEKLDLEDQEMRDIYNVQLCIAKILGKVDYPYKMLPTIMKFAKGDYLQSTLPALYSAFHKSPERILYSYVDQLSKQAVSTRKHAIFLSCAVLDKECTTRLLKTTNHTNVSSQKHLFSASLKYFLKNPSQELLDKVIISLSNIGKSDLETLETLVTIKVPLKYRSQYVEKCWYFYEGLEGSHVKIDSYLEKLIENMSEIIISLTDEFITYVIKKYFVKNVKGFPGFVIRVLKYRSANSVQSFNLVFELLSNASSNSVGNFFQVFIDLVSENPVENRHFIYIFSEYWCKHFTITKQLRSHISLKLLLLRLENYLIENYAHAVLQYMDELILQLTILVFPILKEQLCVALRTLEEVDQLRFLMATLNARTDADACVLVMQLVGCEHNDDRKELRNIYTNIIDVIKNVDIPVAAAYYKMHLAFNDTEY